MTKRGVIFALALSCLLVGGGLTAYAQTHETYETKSLGYVEVGDDFTFDADDFTTIKNSVEDGKTLLSATIHQYTGNTYESPSFTDLAQGIDDVYNAGYTLGTESVEETIILYFGGREILASSRMFGSSGGAWHASVTHVANGLVVENIDPKIFSHVRYKSAYSYGSASGDYPSSQAWGYFQVKFVDRVTGETVLTSGVGNVTVSLASLENPVDMYVDGRISTCSCCDCWAQCWLSETYLTVRNDYTG